ncbi:MAG: RNA 3'-phosphate cyclase [candidate division NC10 bacterium]|nr:RNA 3'-phosphate cyclase [candidate division NC10 bacterium]
MLHTGASVLRVDGAQGEGGGQVLRTALALSAIRGVPVEIHSIRARRKTPGLQAQHLTAVTALAAVSGARVEGAHLGSQRVRVVPGPIQPGEYRFDVGTAGSTALVLQALLVPLALAGGPSRITLTGGTHVPWSPPADYMQEVWLPALADLGLCARLDVGRWGFYPKGGGRIVVEVEGGADLRPISLLHRIGGLRLRGVSAVANLPRGIAERQRDRALRRLAAEGRDAEIAVTEAESPGTGSFLMLVAEVGGLRAGFSALGERGKPAEQVADEAVNALLEFLKGEAGCDPHLADQLVLPMALTPGTSRLTTSRVTRHLLTTAQVVQQILGCLMQIGGEEGSPGAVTIEGVGTRVESRESRAERPEVRAESREPRGERGEPRAERPEPGALPAATCLRATHRQANAAQAGGRRAATSEIRNPQSEIVPSPLIRKARAEDVPAIQKLVAHFAVRGDLLPRTLNELYQHLRDFFVCQVDGEVVGICALSVYWEDLAEVRSLAVQEVHGGKGLGATLVNACLAEAASLGVRRVFALTYRPGFFEKLGFRSIDKRELPQKIWKDCIKCAKFACCDETALIRDT